MLTVRERVAAGMAYYDKRRSDWWQIIDLNTFEIQDSCNCIAGQIEGDFGKLPLRVPEAGYLGLTASWAITGKSTELDFDALEEEWILQIIRRRICEWKKQMAALNAKSSSPASPDLISSEEFTTVWGKIPANPAGVTPFMPGVESTTLSTSEPPAKK